MIYLYLKTHNKTGLKYLGKTTSKDPFKYRGSGLYWKQHLSKHGNDVDTKILGEFDSVKEARKEGIRLSRLWNIIDSDEFANLMEETCDGTVGKGRKMTSEHKAKLSKSHSGEIHTEERKTNVSRALKGKKKSEAHKNLMKEGMRLAKLNPLPDKCPKCGFQTKWTTSLRRHLKRC